MHKAERGLFDLRQGRPLFVAAEDGAPGGTSMVLAPVEGLRAETVEQLRAVGAGPLNLVVTHHRVRSMGLAGAANGNGNGSHGPGSNGHGRPDAFSLHLNGEHRPERILRLASATDTDRHHGAPPRPRSAFAPSWPTAPSSRSRSRRSRRWPARPSSRSPT